MMMQMLHVGGLDCVRDNENGHFEHYEHERAINGNWTEQDLCEWKDKAVKILLSHVVQLPPRDYRVIVMRRDYDSIRRSAESLNLSVSTWQDELDGIRRWAARYTHVEVWYEEVLQNPKHECERVAQVVGRPLNIAAMAKIPTTRRVSMVHRIVDISSNNPHPINWHAVKAAGIDAVMVKATEGTQYTNPFYHGDMADARAAGVLGAAYHFARFANPIAEANYFRGVAGHDAKILDVEDSTNVAWMNQFLAALGEASTQEMTYGSASTLPNNISRGLLWVAAWGGAAPAKNEALWQYTDAGTIPGINAPVDVSAWLGSEAQYAAFFGDVSPVIPPGPPHPVPPVYPVPPNVVVPPFPLPAGQWYGPESPDPRNHSGMTLPNGEPGLKVWQDQMLVRGWKAIGAADGKFGVKTETVCRQFQSEKGLVVDGLVGPSTWHTAWAAPVT